MRPNTAIKYSWFLILLSLGHEFTSAYRINHQSLHQHVNLDIDPLVGAPFRPSSLYRDPQLHPEYFNGDYLLRNTDEEFSDQSDKDSAPSADGVSFVQPEKRGWATVLVKLAGVILVLSVGASIGGVGMEAWFKLAGCCKSGYSGICSKEKEIKRIQDYLIKGFKAVDFGSLTARNLLEDITQTNYRIKEIWGDLKRIQELQVELLTELDLIKAFNTEWNKIAEQIKQLNDSYRGLSYAQLNFQFKSMFDNLKGTLFAVGGFALIGIQTLGTYAFNKYAKNQLNKKIADFSKGKVYKELVTARHTKAARILGVDKVGINAHLRETYIARQKSKFSAQTFAKVLNVVSILGGGFSIYLEVAAAINRFKKCADLLSDADKMVKQGRKGKAKMIQVYKNVTDYIKFVDLKGFQYIKGQLTGAGFLNELQDTLDLVNKAGTQSVNMKNASISINAFLMGINDADAKTTRSLSAYLAQSLAKVKFLYSCYINRRRLINYVNERCKNGTKPLRGLYDDASVSFNTGGKVNSITCNNSAGVPYFSFSDMQKEWAKTAKRLKLSTDCILNSPSKKSDACRKLKEEKKSLAIVAKEMGLTEQQVTALTTNCPAPTLSPADTIRVCKLKKRGWTDAEIADFYSSIALAMIKAVVCPTPTPAKPGR